MRFMQYCKWLYSEEFICNISDDTDCQKVMIQLQTITLYDTRTASTRVIQGYASFQYDITLHTLYNLDSIRYIQSCLKQETAEK